MKVVSVLPGMALAVCAFATAAAPPSSPQEPIVVTATRVPTPVERLGSSVTVITAEQVERNQWHTIADALSSVPGLRVVPAGGAGAQTSVFTRGTNSNHTLILIDGIEIADPSTPSGAFDFAHLTVTGVERIEIVRGSQSTLYGSDAIGGVINIITKSGSGPFNARAELEAGSFHTFGESAGVSGSTAGLRYALDVAHSDTHGESITPRRLRGAGPVDNDGYRNTTASLKLGATPAEQTEINLVARHIKASSELDVGLGEDPDAETQTKQRFLRIEAKAALLDRRWRPTIALSNTTHDRTNVDERQSSVGDEDHTHFRGDKTKLEFQNDIYLTWNNIVTVGVETEKEKMTSSGTSIIGSSFGDFVLTQNTNAEAKTKAFYVQDQYQAGASLSGTIGVRVDNPDTFAAKTTYRLTPIYVLRDTTTRLKASYGTGYKTPSLFERFGSTPTNLGTSFTGNPDLKPEESKGWEAGIEQAARGGRVDFGATYFKNNIDNLIQTVFTPSFDSTTVNVARAETSGMETFVTVVPAVGSRVRLDYTYTDTSDERNRALVRRPKHMATVSVEHAIAPRAKWVIDMHYTGKREDIERSATGGRITTGGYAVLTVAGTFNVSNHVAVFARVNNLLDREYEPVSGFQGPTRGIFVGVRGTL